MLNNGYSEATKWIYENPEEYEETLKELYELEDKERNKTTKKAKFKENFSVRGLKLFPHYELEEIEIPF